MLEFHVCEVEIMICAQCFLIPGPSTEQAAAALRGRDGGRGRRLGGLG